MNYIVIDDEPLARKAVTMLASRYPELNLAGQFNSAQAAAKFLDENDTDLIFLDINMPGMSGIEFAKTLSQKYLVVFTTAYSEFAAESYEVDALDYLIKPIEAKRFDHAVSKAVSFFEMMKPTADEPQTDNATTTSSDKYFFVKANRRNYRVCYDDILYIEGLKDYVIIQLENQRLHTHMNLATISPLLPTSNFIRVSKSYIVNINKIDSFDSNDLYIADYIVPIGPAYRQTLLNNLLG